MSISSRVILASIVMVIQSTAAWGLPLSERERLCQLAIEAGGRQFFADSLAAFAVCEDHIARGILPAGTDCQIEAGTTAKRTIAATRLADRITSRCAPDVAATLGLGGDCAAARTPDTVIGCLQGNHDANASRLINAAN